MVPALQHGSPEVSPMNSFDVLGYSYDAAVHCESCTRERFPEADAEFSNVQDAEGNELNPIFAGDETDPKGEYCVDCGEELSEPWDDNSAACRW